ncbi:MarR family transcriptional regulator [Actinoalloteichus sp. AHMU CJ021]|uniref:DNA-binding transcriptional regulator, MarR family n=1 Tax=Actinoalloteichus caeruleus DSM 43889 TaxID=1120930 RepID=A0ABT1JPE7_ACTCY|nr:MarR family winged helix-turn-helix transcriptional regulator [Actinoalloteichus caeruleus]AUS80174.1 MarR family transcriptional regulator [Actinoalloteichus sp. AHMU CJ021]MCP2334400.1 DNA-binding transcriptional regulator, MarR family [Actinoalloteichus caeruleus DSM 43889]
MTGVDVRAGRAATRRRVGVWRSLMEVHSSVLRELERELTARHGLSVSEFDTVVNIPTGGVGLSELTGRVVLSQSAVSRLVDRLTRRGLLERTTAPGDSRAVRVRLTSLGRRLQVAAIRTNAEVVERCFAGRLSEEELRVLGAAFDRLRAEEPPGEPTASPGGAGPGPSPG